MDGGCGTFVHRPPGKRSKPGPLYSVTCDFEAVEWAFRKFIFLSKGRIVERSKLVFLPVFRIVPSSFRGNEKLALNSDDLSHRSRVSSGNEPDVAMSSWGGGIGKRRGLLGVEGERRDAGEPPSGGATSRGGVGADRGDTNTSSSASLNVLPGGTVKVISGRLE